MDTEEHDGLQSSGRSDHGTMVHASHTAYASHDHDLGTVL
jgi:hypothetical protein